MSGICGIFNWNKQPVSYDQIEEINDSLIHRGPDYGNVKILGNIAFGYRGLRIMDPTADVDQPISTKDRRFTIVLAGKIYNYIEIREKLNEKGLDFLALSEVEVVLKAYEIWGTDSFAMFNGSFALAIYDGTEKKLLIVRDQYGVSPLYYMRTENTFIFGSEIKAILKHHDANVSLNSQALIEYIWFGNPLGENTIYNEILEVKPGNYLQVSENEVKEFTYFEINSILEIKITEEAAIQKTKYLLEESVKRQILGDVPIGVFLSGGIDSSAITSFASKHYKGKLKTFSVGFDYDKGFNELELAREIAEKFNTEHHEINISGDKIIDIINELVNIHDEPFGDAADIPLYLLTKELKGSIKVVLQGDGGDEFFGGYSRYFTLAKASRWSKFSFLSSLISLSTTKNVKVLRLQRFLNAISQKEMYKRNALLLTMESKYSNPLRVFNKKLLPSLKNLDPFESYKNVYNKYRSDMDPVQALFYTDVQIILKDTYFEKIEKPTLVNSIQVRTPFIDKDLTEFILSVPASIKTKNGTPKYLLKKALNNIVPNKILYGKKRGFGVPYEYWLKTSLNKFFLQQISTEKVSNYINIEEVLRMYNLLLKNKGNYGFLLWKTFIFAVWLNQENKLAD